MANYYCEYCGTKYSSVTLLTGSSCHRHPNGPNKGKHKLYEGSEKRTYTCKYCGNIVKIDDIFCTNCGKKIKTELRCNKCGHPVNDDDIFCTNCGNKLNHEWKCSNCGSTVNKDDTFCFNCGNKI